MWSPKTGINITKTYYERRKQVKESLANKTLSVVTVLVRIIIVYLYRHPTFRTVRLVGRPHSIGLRNQNRTSGLSGDTYADVL